MAAHSALPPFALLVGGHEEGGLQQGSVLSRGQGVQGVLSVGQCALACCSGGQGEGGA